MTKIFLSLPLLCFMILFITTSGLIFNFTHGQGTSEATWCIAKPGTPKENLQDDIEYACSQMNNCTLIQYGGACFIPDEPINHASVVMNIYYQRNGKHYWNCDFNGTGVITTTDPSYDGCKYEYDN